VLCDALKKIDSNREEVNIRIEADVKAIVRLRSIECECRVKDSMRRAVRNTRPLNNVRKRMSL
jgi:hypothetical protein